MAEDNKPGIFRKLAGAYTYSLLGNWSEHKRRLAKLKELKNKNDDEDKAIAEHIADVEAKLAASNTSKTQIENEKFNQLILLKSFSEHDLNEVQSRYKYYGVFFSIGFVVSMLISAYVIYNGADIVHVATCMMAIIYFSLKAVESWWRFTQIKERRLMSFKRWLLE